MSPYCQGCARDFDESLMICRLFFRSQGDGRIPCMMLVVGHMSVLLTKNDLQELFCSIYTVLGSLFHDGEIPRTTFLSG